MLHLLMRGTPLLIAYDRDRQVRRWRETLPLLKPRPRPCLDIDREASRSQSCKFQTPPPKTQTYDPDQQSPTPSPKTQTYDPD